MSPTIILDYNHYFGLVGKTIVLITFCVISSISLALAGQLQDDSMACTKGYNFSQVNCKSSKVSYGDYCAEKPDGDYPDPCSCSHFVGCYAKEFGFRMPCPNGPDNKPLYYVQCSGPDPSSSHCDYSVNVNCSQAQESAYSY